MADTNSSNFIFFPSSHSFRIISCLTQPVVFRFLLSVKRDLSHYQTTILDSSKLKEFADNNFKFDENGKKLSKRLENTVGKGEIARYEQFLLFPQCFQKACFPGASKMSLCGNGLNICRKYRTILACAVYCRLTRA